MCGIIGLCEKCDRISLENKITKMRDTMLHRGPDERNIFIDYDNNNVALAHTRLVIIDKESGKQPMLYKYKGEEYVIIYNGELYNTEEVRELLKKENIYFDGYSDTEVVLKAYAVFKEKCLDLFNGIFSFAIYEKNSRKIFLARDRMGVKPLFYYKNYRDNKDNIFCFASEIKAILAHDKIKAVIDSEGLAHLFFVSPGRQIGNGVFKNIYELPPASYMIFDIENNTTEIKKYWQLKAEPHTDNFNQTVEKTRYLLKDSIERQLVSDYPIGTFLSGGIDSSIISSVANEKLKSEGKILKTFSLNYEDNDKYFKESFFQPSSDTEYIYRMQQYLQCENYWCVLSNEKLADALYKAVDARDLPSMADIDSSMLMLCEGISKNVKVALSGECADEIFGGYPWYRNISQEKCKVFPWSNCLDYRTSFINENYKGIIDSENYIENIINESLENISYSDSDNTEEKRTREMINLNMDWFMQNLLERKDRMSMANSLEVRVPFCDYRIVQYLYSVPYDFKCYNGYEKGLLRYAFQDYLPDEVLWRKKSPYPKTHHPIYLKKVSAILQDIIANNASPLLKIADKNALLKLINSADDVPWYGQLMKKPQIIAYFIQLNYWLEKYNVILEI